MLFIKTFKNEKEKKMKKFITLLLALLMVFSLVGCSNTDSGDDSGSDDDTFKVAVMPAYVPEEWSQTIIESAQAACDYYGYEMTVLDPDYDVNNQIARMEDAATAYDALIMQCVNGTALIEKCKEVQEQGLIVVDFDCLIANTGSIESPADGSIKSNDQEGGAVSLDYLVEAVGDDATIFVYEETPGVDTGLFRNTGLLEAAKEKYPNLTILEGRSTGTGDSRVLVKDYFTDQLTAHPEIEAFFGYFGDAGIGAYVATDELGRKDVKLACYDATDDQINYMKTDSECNIVSTVNNNPGMLGGAAVEIVHAIKDWGYTKRSAEDVFQLSNDYITLADVSTHEIPMWSEPIYTEDDFK